MYFEKGNFDTTETQIVFDVCNLQQSLIEIKHRVEAKKQVGRLDEQAIKIFADKVSLIKQTVTLLTAIPFVKLYKNYNYFKFNKALQDVNYN